MGLDMWLYARKTKYTGYGKEIKYPKNLERLEISITRNDFKSKELITDYKIGYWRKFNALHNWIVENCANGEDNCQIIYVYNDKLKELRNIVNEVLLDHSKAPELLPTCEGFFFGGLEYDEWYFNDLEYTKDVLDIIFADKIHEKYDIVYCASW